MRVELHPEARAEIREAAGWYEERRPGLGEQLVAEISAALERVEAAPSSFALWTGISTPRAPAVPIRRVVIQRFPYAIAFEAHPDHVRVLAVAHTKRRPLYWIARTY